MNNINLPNHDSYAYIKSRYYKKPKSKTITKVNGNRLDEIEKEMEYNKSKYEKRIKQLKREVKTAQRRKERKQHNRTIQNFLPID